MPAERKLWLDLLTILGGGAIAATIAYSPLGIFLLTRAAVRRIVDFFRGEEAVLQGEIAAKRAEVEEREQALTRAREEIAEMESRLAQIGQAITEVEAEPTYDGRFEDPDGGYLGREEQDLGKAADLEHLIAQLERD